MTDGNVIDLSPMLSGRRERGEGVPGELMSVIKTKIDVHRNPL